MKAGEFFMHMEVRSLHAAAYMNYYLVRENIVFDRKIATVCAAVEEYISNTIKADCYAIVVGKLLVIFLEVCRSLPILYIFNLLLRKLQ